LKAFAVAPLTAGQLAGWLAIHVILGA